MKKYTLTVPDANKPSVKISGLKMNSNPFPILGEIHLEKCLTDGGLPRYRVTKSDFPNLFPQGEFYWSTTDLFCNACNVHIHDFGSFDRLKYEYKMILHSSNFPIFSKHKITGGWLVVIYDPKEIDLNEPIEELLSSRILKSEFRA